MQFSHLIKGKGRWKIFWFLTLCFSSNSFLWTVNFFLQLSKVVDLKVYLNICRVVKILLSTLLSVFYAFLIGWLFICVTLFRSLGKSVQLLDVTINKLSWLIILFPCWFRLLWSSFMIFSLFLSKTLFLISQFSFVLWPFSLGGLFYF